MSKLLETITSKDISYILNNPWKFTHYEWKLHNEHNKKSSLDHLIEQVELTRNGGYSKIWKIENNLPLAILGAIIVSDKKLEGFFVASKHMEEENYALKVSFEMRKIFEEQSNNYKGCTLGLYSESKHIDNQLSWLRFIGFKYMPDGNRGNTRYFEYVSRVS
ncbi:hypothetical protein FJ651_10095 [Paucihalobacter ruber]|uniref:N-acetyltransferase domain-containing protein n=1 Tax=Paucihalobacter ruber TaxID=2567861 RepID=A0A506PIR6_9FLAO|nr:hypothetical protein [Paucihalobacter ruber]TPV33428.1 hypothetical protein FJ651_10095 [Paucihalobacter ruber]